MHSSQFGQSWVEGEGQTGEGTAEEGEEGGMVALGEGPGVMGVVLVML
jgi:hypothetical protein